MRPSAGRTCPDRVRLEPTWASAYARALTVPRINTDRAGTLAMMDRIERVAETQHARIVFQHDPGHFRTLPTFPAHLE
jgi:hypothetical protein